MGLLTSLVKSQKIITLAASSTVFDAVEKMAAHLVGSIIVMDQDRLVGIFTERDLLNRVTAKRLDPKTTLLAQVMSKNVATIPIHETAQNCFKQMQKTKCRHIPIVDGEKVVGIVTMRNILEWIVQEIEEENVQLKRYIQS